MAHLTLSLLGSIQMTLDGRALVEFESDKARALLIYLALAAGRPIRRETLSTLLWPEQDDKSALQNLRKTLHRLRQAIRDVDSDHQPFLLVTPQAVEFNAAADFDLDISAFRTLLAETQHHRHRRLSGCRTCAERLARAADLYRRDFLAGFVLKDSAPFDEWCAIQREQLHAQALDALGQVATYHERRGDYLTASEYARRQLELEPWLEAAHRQLMRAFWGGGRRAAALAQYEQCRKILAAEWGVAPDAETVALYEQIRDGQAAVPRADPIAPARHFPPRRTSFVGRETELAQISDRLQDPDCRLLTIIGAGGSGKTRLAVEAALRDAGAFQDGACFVSLAPLASGDLVTPTLAQLLRIPVPSGADVKARVFDWLRDKEMLLVLDNFEHLIPDALIVSELLESCPSLTILATSREALRLYGEHIVPLAPLAVPVLQRVGRRASLAELSVFPSIELFVQRSQAVAPVFSLSDGNAGVVGEICARLDGLPLAIELAAARAGVYAPDELLARLKQSFALLPPGGRDLPPRQRTLRQTIEWSYNLLAPLEQVLFRRLAVFAGGFDMTSAEAVCNADRALGSDAREVLAALVDKSLISYVQLTDAGPTTGAALRYDFLETIREYAWSRLDESGEMDAVRRWHLAYFTELAEEAEAKLTSAERPLWLGRLDVEQSNLRSVLAWAIEAEPVGALRLATALGTMWEVRLPLFIGDEILRRALSRAQDAPPTLRAKALYWVGRMALRKGVLRQAHMELTESLDLYRGLGDRRGLALTLNDLASVMLWQGKYTEAEAALEESLAIRREFGEAWWIAQTLNNLGMVNYRRGTYSAAQRYFEECLHYFRQTGAEMPLAWPIGGLGEAALGAGEYAEARRLLEESVAIWRRNKFAWALAYRLNDLGLLMSTVGDQGAARRIYAESLAISREIGDERGLAFALDGLARVAAAEGHAVTAAKLFGAASVRWETSNATLSQIELAAHEGALEQVRLELGDTRAQDELSVGRLLSLEQVTTLLTELEVSQA
ncbi:MAG: tetratricopeptide repeat protein [Anaerolineae bacterium]